MMLRVSDRVVDVFGLGSLWGEVSCHVVGELRGVLLLRMNGNAGSVSGDGVREMGLQLGDDCSREAVSDSTLMGVVDG